jgi:hypothetical protein
MMDCARLTGTFEMGDLFIGSIGSQKFSDEFFSLDKRDHALYT